MAKRSCFGDGGEGFSEMVKGMWMMVMMVVVMESHPDSDYCRGSDGCVAQHAASIVRPKCSTIWTEYYTFGAGGGASATGLLMTTSSFSPSSESESSESATILILVNEGLVWTTLDETKRE